MQFHLVRVPVKLIFLAKPKFVLAVGCYAYRPDTASVAGTLEGYESILRYVLHHAGGILILKRPGNRLVRHTESLGIIHYPAFIGRNHDVPGTYDAIHKERQGLAFPTLTGGNIVRVSNIIRTISPFRLPLGIHGIDKTPGNRGMRFQFGSVQSVFRKTAGKELRNRLIVCAVVFVAAVVVTLAYADRLIDLLTAMGQGFYTFVSIAPQEKLMQYFRVSLLAAVVVTVPVALYQVYAFAKPGLKKSETFFLKLVILLGLALFVVGVMFAYKLMMPFMLRFLSTGIEGADYIQTTTSIESYVSLCLTIDRKSVV